MKKKISFFYFIFINCENCSNSVIDGVETEIEIALRNDSVIENLLKKKLLNTLRVLSKVPFKIEKTVICTSFRDLKGIKLMIKILKVSHVRSIIPNFDPRLTFCMF